MWVIFWFGGWTFIFIFASIFILKELCHSHNCNMMKISLLLTNLLSSTINLAMFVSKWKILVALVTYYFLLLTVWYLHCCISMQNIRSRFSYSVINTTIFSWRHCLRNYFLKSSTTGFVHWKGQNVSQKMKIDMYYIWYYETHEFSSKNKS